MNRKPNILAAFLVLALALLLTACGAGNDRVERFAEAAPGSGENIAIPGYETISFKAGKQTQKVRFTNPADNACTFVLSLSLDDGDTIWTGEAIKPGEMYTQIELNRALDKRSYQATLHYNCYSLNDNTPLNGVDIKLTLDVK